MECKFSPVSLIDYWEIEFYNKNNQTCIAFLFIAKCNFTCIYVHSCNTSMYVRDRADWWEKGCKHLQMKPQEPQTIWLLTSYKEYILVRVVF